MRPIADPVDRVRLLGMCEGVSFLLLLGLAMPLKYLADMPEAVLIVGWAHGVLFLAFVAALLIAKVNTRLPWRLAALAFVAALLPFGPFVVDPRLKPYAAVAAP